MWIMSQFKKKKDIKTCTTLNQFNVIDIQYSAAENKFFQLHKGVLSTSHSGQQQASIHWKD